MDTRLKKTNKVKGLIIALCVMLPAFILVALYPRMEKAMLAKAEKEAKRIEEIYSDEENEWEVDSNVVNYAMEAMYYLYGQTIQEMTKSPVDFSVLEEYGWVNDFYRIHAETEYCAIYGEDTEDIGTQNTKRDLSPLLEEETDKEAFMKTLYKEGVLAYLILEFNSYGQIANVEMDGREKVEFPQQNLYFLANESVKQYENNADYYYGYEADRDYYGYDVDTEEDFNELAEEAIPMGILAHTQETTAASDDSSNKVNRDITPQDFKAVFLISEDSYFATEISNFYGSGYASSKMDYIDLGILWVIAFFAFVVAAVALLLPFVKKLNTGWEKLFCIPLEAVAILTITGFCCAVGMYMVMIVSTKNELSALLNESGMIEIVGLEMSLNTVYAFVLVGNFLGWAGCFFMEYIVAAALRQFLCNPIEYVQKRFFCGKLIKKFAKWCKSKGKQFYVYVTDIKIGAKLNQSIIKILVVNVTLLALLLLLVMTGFLGIFWDSETTLFFGIVLLIAYHVGLYVIMRRLGEKTQQQYDAIYDAVHEMAKGNLKISLQEKELGIMEPIGKELEKVQEGFSKAVQKEAQSQNMKTELITNVSHDLKTPLTAIITYVDLLKKEDITEEERRSYVKTLDQKSQRLKILIEDLFEVSKANSGNMKMNFMEVDVVSLMKQVRLEMEDKIAASGLVFRWNFPEEKIILTLDGQKTYRVFENLLNNILKYSMPNSRVYIDIVENNLEVQIVFRNISATELDFDAERLMDRFVRGDASRKTEGSGLGLAIVKSFVELQNGKVDISVDGDLFKVTLSWRK